MRANRTVTRLPEPFSSFPKELSADRFQKICQLAALLANELEEITTELRLVGCFFPDESWKALRNASLQEQVGRFERLLIESTLTKTGGNQRKAAAQLGLKPTTLNAKIKRYGIAINRY